MSDTIIQSVMPFISALSTYGAWIAFFAAFGETLIGLGFFLPGSTLLLLMGVLAGQGHLEIVPLLLFAITGAYAGDIVNYHLGRRYGVALLQKPWLHLPQEKVEAARRFLDTYGAKSIFFARFLPALKESVPFLAGSVRMGRGKFLFWDLLGAIGWALEFIGVGYLFSTSLALAQVWLSRTLTGVALLLLVLLLLWLLKRFIVQNAPVAKTILLALWHAFLQTSPLQQAMARHPRIVAFMRRRFDKTSFYGWTLTLLSLAFLYVLALLGGSVEDFITRDPIVYVDRIIAHLVVQWRTPELTAFFTWITYLGRKEVVLVILAGAILLLLLHRRYADLLALLFSFTGSVAFLYLGKLAFQRPRPETALYFEPTFSFPSGHATIAVAFYGFLGYLLMHHAKGFKTRVNIFFGTTIVVLLIGLSRIYLAEHYLSDVYSGFLLGTLWVIAAMALLKWLETKPRFAPRKPYAFAKHLRWAVLLGMGGFYVWFGLHFHYKPAVHPVVKSREVSDIRALFSKGTEPFARNFFGYETQPVNLLMTVPEGEAICDLLKRAGWERTETLKHPVLPLYWQAHRPVCTVFKKIGDRIALLRLWKSDVRYKGKQLYVAGADAISGWRWDIVPRYILDMDEARDAVADDLQRHLPVLRRDTLKLNPPLIGKHLFTESWFSDGEAVVLEVGGR